MGSDEPPTKKAKKEENEELESDALVDDSARLKETVRFLPRDCTLNVADSGQHGRMLSCLSTGGLTYLLAGARANTGIKSGRYMFQVSIVELLQHKTDANSHGRAPQRNLLRVGLSLAGSSLFIGDDDQSICFDADGNYIHNKKKTLAGAKIDRHMCYSLLVNLDPTSPNANTVSLFRNGERASKPQTLPESLQGKVLYPTLTFRNVTVSYNFGTMVMSHLPFVCRSLQDASKKDVDVTSDTSPKDGKFTAIFPTALPDEGCFQWLDWWLERNPDYVELSDRTLLDWAQRSGVGRMVAYNVRTCTDKPALNFGLPSLDDRSVQKALRATVPFQKRNLVVMEMKAMLLKEERDALLSSFASFKKVAVVLAGEPPASFKNVVHELMLTEKQLASDAEFRKHLEEEKKKKQALKLKRAADKKKQQELKAGEERRKRLEEIIKKKKEDQIKKKEEEAKKKNDQELGIEAKAEDEEKKEELKEETKEEIKEEAKEEKEEDSEDDDMQEDPEPPVVELTPEEKTRCVLPLPQPDLAADVLNKRFADFSFPQKSDGFDEIRYEWQDATRASEYLKGWMRQKKRTARIEDLSVGDWFAKQQTLWSSFLVSCKAKQNEYKTNVAKATAARANKEKTKADKNIDAEVVESEEQELNVVDVDGVDVFGVDNVFAIGGRPNQPLFSQFQFEDWALMCLRFELHLLVHAFKKDVEDPERREIHMDNISHYYEKYFKKKFNPQFYGVKSIKEAVDLVSDTVGINKRSILQSLLPGDLEVVNVFLLLTEEARRDRNRRLDLGDESAKIKLQTAVQAAGTGLVKPGASISLLGQLAQGQSGGWKPFWAG